MITLPNSCKCSELKVNPKNRENSRASVRKNWFIYYRFYNPTRLALAFEKGGYNNRTKTDIRSVLNFVGQAAV
jgi:hypothetical protein